VNVDVRTFTDHTLCPLMNVRITCCYQHMWSL